MHSISPVYLFADSQLLFWKENSQRFLKSVLNFVSEQQPCAAYIGAANGDQPEFFQIFQSAMEDIGISDCRMIMSDFSADDQVFLDKASIILLAGGNVARGWKVIESTGMKEIILRRYSEGAVLIGVSAGAAHLGSTWLVSEDSDALLNMLSIVPYVISSHEEKEGWVNLKKIMRLKGEEARGIGMPFGTGMIYHPDHTLEPLRSELFEFAFINKKLTSNLLMPDPEEKQRDSIH